MVYGESDKDNQFGNIGRVKANDDKKRMGLILQKLM